jgi:RHS repeat-associated protein
MGSRLNILTIGSDNDFDIANSPSDYKFYTYYGPGNHPEWTDLVEMVVDGRARVIGAPFTVRMTYNGRQQIMSVENASTTGQYPTVRHEYDTYGNQTAVIDELGHRKDYLYDDYRRQTSCTEQVNGPGPNGTNVTSRRTDWIYDRVIDNFIGSGNTFRNTAHTSKDWRVQIEPAFNTAGERRVTARTFDFNNRITSEQTGVIQPPGYILPSNPWHNGPDTEIHRFTYDENGQKSSYTDPRGRVTNYGYNNRNRLETTIEPKRASQPTNPVTRFDYDAAGNKLMVTFPDNNTQHWDLYDPFGQAWKFTDERHHDTDLIYEWGPMKKLQTVTTYRERGNPPGGTETQLTTFEYDGMGRPNKTIFPDSSTEETTYQLGQVWKYKTRRGQTKVIDQYDARERENHRYWLKADGTPDGTTPAVTSVWDDASRLTKTWNVFSTIDYTYNDVGQVITEGNTVAGSGMGGNGALRQVIYWRYPSGEVAQITYPNGAVVTRGYTARGQLAGVGWSGGSTSFAYLPDGDVDYQAWSNGVTTTNGYDGRGMISSVLHKNIPMNKDLARREYWRNDRDQILAWKRGTVNAPNVMEDGRGNRYAYDEEGQLTSASYRAQDPAGAATGAMRADVFEYDKMGNRMGTHDIASRGSTNFTRDNNGLNQYSSWTPSAINYDDDMGGDWGYPGHANGVTMQEGYITASFNALNQPMAMWSPVYNPNFLWFGYDPLGRCVKRWTGTSNGAPVGSTTYYYYDDQNMVQEGSSAMFATRIYVHGAGVDEIVASQAVSSGEWRYHHYDGQGNCILLTDTSGAIREQYDYDAFGMPYVYNAGGATLAAAAQWGNRFLFTGREWLSELRIYDYRARQYQPELGRFLQPDPKEFGAGDYNLYRYCHNDPVNKSDPTGLVENIQADFQWKSACFFDSANKEQGSYNAFMYRNSDHASVSFSKPDIKLATPNYIHANGGEDNAVTKIGGGIVTNSSIDPSTGHIDVVQTVRTTTLIVKGSLVPKPGEKVDPKSRYGQEMVRIKRFRDATARANSAAQTLARAGFTDRASAEKTIHDSTRGILDAEARQMQRDYDLNHGTDKGY